MKQQNIIQRLCLFLFVLVLAVPALAQKERGGGYLQHRLGSRLENLLRPCEQRRDHAQRQDDGGH